MKLNTGAKEIQQVNPGGPDKQPKHQAPTISSIDKSLSRNHHRVWSPTHRRAIKEESKVANRDSKPKTDPEVIQLFFMPNSTEHEISTTHKN